MRSCWFACRQRLDGAELGAEALQQWTEAADVVDDRQVL